MKIILSVIAVCLVMISVKLYTPDAKAQSLECVLNGGEYCHSHEADIERYLNEIINDQTRFRGLKDFLFHYRNVQHHVDDQRHQYISNAYLKNFIIKTLNSCKVNFDRSISYSNNTSDN